ncbi:UDP-N-acetylmuramoyl-L-alanyl-D-glutamate--2,6-diaminopimelate ligase [Campylobacter insulaenigrae]|uniref:UDP-N-acetylmuramoyl-L-alanyl-D-glutamate--2,6-diaminopimelate ligase n=1 Tax=Campylobacter insulaenigrae TaxID=260714 RepID=A0ABY3G7F4_9BACT|nr:UDP-N-acetylmuramoyl-L-alanyl-D-glutamate--2,6-diaminopimelate ligase [Campylobacter insulaenigrae]MCR6572200.1 UDP-N-acetylmuramoyl-L-alanyl-D-glutamate--2,6-diaminopimelate ligase [Campylobacter insulaenigrae]MCR6574474.1 UDP-N-acetylmuramoyl-L-alanyl-D-glutamate--2,6-diaminopimelate ligase [Campylobacter insulaenigrae]MCR6576570.1 UDP-N-acetylmuramoyl-L-alanyl-D-glutamate--2,6-diaminopimelate ligase [Campylobacter insulaenigrae]MCR6579558.1 UDP-N-acetylmuramoyl-L-alanyl-D-glutamate--2,6-d
MIVKVDDTFITDNSSECEYQCYFLKTTQNERFIQQALEKQAKIINTQECKRLLKIDENIKLIGISGTNGKTTTAGAIYSILLDLGYKCALMGTRGSFINDKKIYPKGLTTTPILQTLEFLALASKEKCDFLIMEVSSHALVQNRIEGLEFKAKIFTNITQDHLDFHKTFENYQKAKESFFTDESMKFINKDAKAIKFNVKNAFTYGIENPSFYHIKAYALKHGIEAVVNFGKETFLIDSSLVGLFNLYNLLAASACVNELVKPNLNELEKAISNFGGIEGRMQVVAKNVIVDFAHTPDGIEKVLDALRYKDLIVVFGAGGDRDKSKRPLMARVAKHYAKKLIITSDNPRSEEAMDIVNDILSGIEKDENVFVECDRKQAIAQALKLQQNDEFVVILGKGDEDYQEIKGVKYPFNDKEVVLEILKEGK